MDQSPSSTLRTENVSHMSDHWNLLADLLGTPNYAPRAKKGAKADPVVAAEVTAPVEPVAKSDNDSNQESERTKAGRLTASDAVRTSPTAEVQEEAVVKQPVKERSMLQSSWDALAGLFGVSNEPTRESQPASKPDTQETAPTTPHRGAKQKKSPAKSMWDKPQEPVADVPKPEVGDLPRPSFSREEPSATVPVESDRRGPRRSPRRGRSEQGSEESIESPQPVRSERRDDKERESRSSRNESRGESSGDRDSRSARRDRNPRGERQDNREGSSRLSDSRERRPREDRGRGADSQATGKQESGRRSKPSGFAAGLTSGDESADNDLFAIEHDGVSFRGDDSIQATSPHQEQREESESGERVRRKKRRGRRRREDSDVDDSKAESFDQASEVFANDDDLERDGDDLDARPRHGKIPSWTETIGVVVQANVANHQKQSSGGNRGRQRRPNN